MKQGIFTVTENAPLAPGLYRLVLAGDTSACAAPGQFVNIKLDGFYLRRPISVCDWDEKSVTVIYKVLGAGTEAMTAYPAGKTLDVLTGLGNGYDIGKAGDRPLLVGGGVGIPPLYRLAKDLVSAGARPAVVLGFNRGGDMFLTKEFIALGAEVFIATADGSAGVKGFVTDAVLLAGAYTHVYACGPTAMLRALDAVIDTDAQYSMEERMGCGFGACMGCSVETKGGAKRVCRDGPVFAKGEIVW